MSFRQPTTNRHAKDRAWRAWLPRHERALRAVGLPPSVMLSEKHWTDFLHNGYLERYPESSDGFVFDQLSAERMSQLLAILGASTDLATKPMVSWLRHRLGRAAVG